MRILCPETQESLAANSSCYQHKYIISKYGIVLYRIELLKPSILC